MYKCIQGNNLVISFKTIVLNSNNLNNKTKLSLIVLLHFIYFKIYVKKMKPFKVSEIFLNLREL